MLSCTRRCAPCAPCVSAHEKLNDQITHTHNTIALGVGFYLEALDCDVKKPCENPSIGILLCKDKDDEVVEYAMNRSLSPAMVAEYQLQLPDKKLLQAKMQELFQHQN